MRERLRAAGCGLSFLFLALATACGKKAETAPAPASTSATGDRARCIAVREKLAKYPDLMVDQQPERLSGTFPRLSPARRDTAFTVSFVVNMAGKPVMTSYSVSKHVGTRFSAELRKSVATWRYSPATLEGCAVARKVSHTIDTRARSRTGSTISPPPAARSR